MSRSEFYDRAMVEEGAPSMLPLEESPWYDVYAEAAIWIPPSHDVVDLGCGTGRFARFLTTMTPFYGAYTGIDFSEEALSEAEKYTELDDFRCEDLGEWLPEADRAGATTYVCLEVLEHLEEDRKLVKRIPPGHQFVFSVPNYESESHVRYFRNAYDVFDRYAHLLEFSHWALVKIDERKAIHVWETHRRQDAW